MCSSLVWSLISPVWAADVVWPRLWPPLTHCPWWELLARGNTGDSPGPGGRGSHRVRGLNETLLEYWVDVESPWSADIRHCHPSKLCTLTSQVPGDISPAVTQHGPQGYVHLVPRQWPVSPPRKGPSNIPSIMPSHCSGVIIISVGDGFTQNTAETNKQDPLQYWVRAR